MNHKHDKTLEEIQGMHYGLTAMSWYGWGSPVGLGLFILSVGGFLWLLHLAGIIG